MLALVLTSLAFAAKPPPSTEAGHGEEAHGGAHAAGHHYYTDDDDHDGTPNWLDATNGTEPNDETYVVKPVLLHAFNLLVLLGLIGYFVRGPFVDFWRDRAHGIRKELTDSAAKRDEAVRRNEEIAARLARIEGEVSGMLATAETEAKREEEQLVERARREGVRIAEQAERNIRDEVTRARASLRAEAVELAVQLAEGTLRNATNDADQQALARAFLASVGQGERRV